MATGRSTLRAIASVVVVGLVAVACGSGDGASDAGSPAPIGSCDWPTGSYSPARTGATECDTEITVASVERLQEAWFFPTRDAVTANPVVVDGVVYVGDWSGWVYAIDLAEGDEVWSRDTEVDPNVYAGQIVRAATVVDTGEGRRVVVAAGRSLYALDAGDGEVVWRHDLRPGGPDDDPTEIQSAPVVAEGLVLVGFDGHDAPGVPAGVVAVDVETGEEAWRFDPDRGGEPSGCVGVWSSPSVDVGRRLVFVGSASCPSAPEGWGPYTEALYALDLDTGEPRWSYQPHEPNHDDLDFAGAPNLFTAGGRDLVGLGNKDGTYYAVDRDTGELVWSATVAPVEPAGTNFSTGGFIGETAVTEGRIVGGTAIGGPCPCLHALDAATGEVLWQASEPGPTFAGTSIGGGLAFVGSTTDFTLRALDLATGEVLWSAPLASGIGGAPAITRDALIAVAGFREPGVDAPSRRAGVYAFRLGDGPSATTAPGPSDTLPPTTQAPPSTEGEPSPAAGRRCVGVPCDVPFFLKDPPPGTNPTLHLLVRPRPFRLEVRGNDLGDPSAWILPDTPAAAVGAVTYGVFVSVSDDDPTGSLVCVLDGDHDCVTTVLPEPLAESYNRVSVLAIADTTALPAPAEGFARLVTTISFDPPLVLG